MIKYVSKMGGKKLSGVVLLRLDFNTKDDWRMKAALPTIQFILKHAKAVVILSHYGRPLGFQRDFSLKKDAETLEMLLKKNIRFFNHFIFSDIKREIAGSKPKSIFMLENLRFMPGEAKNDPIFAKNLASLGDCFVNDAFAVSHRENASVCEITRYLPSYAGLEMEIEIANLSKIMGKAKKPLVMIFGGAKVEDKLGVLKYFKKKADAFLIGGVLANTLLRGKGVAMGKSLYEKNPSSDTLKLLTYKNIILPTDFRAHEGAILDIGTMTEKLFEEKIKDAKTIVWNGPMGMIERENFARGTAAVGRAVAANVRAFSIIGGGETVMALKRLGLDKNISFISTGGGAMLDFLAGKELPGLMSLMKSKNKRV